VADQPRRLCIVASDLLRNGEFIATLGASLRLRPQEPLAIIMDRRHGGSWMESSKDRRRQPLVDRALATNGFAIVPTSVDPKADRTEDSLLLAGVPTEPLFREDDEDLQRLESILSFRRRRSTRLLPKLGDVFLRGLQIAQKIVAPRLTLPIFTKLLAILICVTLATFALSPAGQNLGKRLIGRIPQASPLTSGGQATAPPAAQLPSADQPPAQTDEDPERTKQARLRDAERLIATPHETSTPPKVTGTTSQEPGTTSRATGTSPKETGTPPKATTAQDGSGRTRTSAKPSAKAATSKATPPRFAGSPRVELAREPVSVGWGDSYALRLLNPAGQPMVVAEVVLIAHMADGTVEKIAMGALPERGTYRATVPTRRSAPINLQVRVNNGEKRVEIPVKR
jgi:hypothetical protein